MVRRRRSIQDKRNMRKLYSSPCLVKQIKNAKECLKGVTCMVGGTASRSNELLTIILTPRGEIPPQDLPREVQRDPKLIYAPLIFFVAHQN